MDNSPLSFLLSSYFSWTDKQRISVQTCASFVLLIAIAGIATIVYQTGGIKYVYSHAMYIPILFAGFILGTTGGFIFAVMAGLSLGPVMPLDVLSGEQQTTFNWLFRSGLFVIAGTVSGLASSTAKQYIEQLRWIAHHNVFTDLPNRRDLLLALPELTSKKDLTEILSLSLLSIENATELKCTFGPAVLESAIDQLTKRIKSTAICQYVFQPETTVLGFVLQCDQDCSFAVRDSLVASSREAISFNGLLLHVDTRIGTVILGNNALSSEDYLKQAEMALAIARQKGKDSFIYQPHLVITAEDNLKLLGELKSAIDNHQLLLHFQPKVEMASGIIRGAEALIRWEHPERGNVPPGAFIPRAEESTLIHSVTEFVLNHAMAMIRLFQQKKVHLTVAINVSTRNLSEPGFAELVAGLMEKYQIEGKDVELEVTESALLLDVDQAIAELNKLNRLNIDLSIDDYGTGYSSLQYLHKLPVSNIKIDQSFIRRLDTDSQVIHIVEATIKMAHSLGMKVIAEGVETPEAYNILKEIGCDFAQGFLIARPMPDEEFERWYKGNGGRYQLK
ncbi:MAG: bifunctional diguanylate cyclase/phosphodiesterase [Candidatus Vecturithrix sp.]|jgi:EAL domain-containing protein (putative c-di-GMP-specific phosphodiesterase class I)/GGDEF domain-containing protein|nr:bifunctional diguanylate cyclase/phosphodiesterase [Candidatus Vecturithrix sp.]